MNAPFPSGHWDLDDRITVVLFAGMGGGCDGLEAAGFPVHLAVNHDPVAIAVHETRHPHTRHLRCDVFEVDPRQATRGRPVRALHASPDCTHFSVAKGSKPVSKRRRSLAWVIPRWAGQVRPEVITMENVREIVTWGPLVAKRDPKTGRVMRLDGSVAARGERVPVGEQWLIPDPRHKGRTWRAFQRHMAKLGYSFEYRNLCCADFGVPTIRTRFFGVARADGGPIHWPARTHAPRQKAKALRLKPWVGAHTIIDWSLPVKSIFGRKKPLAEATLRRIARGVMRYVVNAAEPFIVPITHSGGENRAYPTGDPLHTLTTAHRGELAVVVPTLVDTAHGEGQGRGHSEWPVVEPLRTVGTSKGKALVAAHLQKFRPGASGADAAEPLPTYTSNSFHKRPGGAPPLGVAAVHMEKFNQNGDGTMPDEPLGTVMAGAPRHAVVAATIIKHNHGSVPHQDAGEPLHTVTTQGNKHAIVAATLVQTGYGEREGQAPRALDIGEPIGAQVAGGSKAAVVAAFLAKHNTDVVGNDAREPLSTITTGGERGQTQLAPVMASLRGTARDGRDVREPSPALTAEGNHEMLILPFLQAYYSSGGQDQGARDPLLAVTAKARHGLVTVEVDGVTMVITDICMRMLDPLEGARAHGFDPASLLHVIEVTDKRGRVTRRPPTKTEIGHLVGNSVPPRMVQLLAEANVRRELAGAAA
jgi:DNA (cytosine-5)-methyltransferase 1